MALSSREVLMIIRARDLASRDIAQIGLAFGALEASSKAAALQMVSQGTALLGIGAAATIAGGAVLGFYASSAKASIEYNRQAALTLTQIDEVGVSLEQVEAIGIRVARAIPAPFKEMQTSLYDIFSSTNATAKEAEQILASHAKAAVAGQVSIQEAGRATIAIMNAFGLETKDIDHLLDVQFETVRKGVITYGEFASTIGRAIPSAVRAGASIEELGGAIAFATRNGLSAAMAATSVARAFDLMSNPKFAANLEEIGIKATDAEGNFRPLVDVTDELRNKFKGLSESEISQKLKDLTQGAGGTIQAMRFLNLAVKDGDGLFRSLTDSVRNSEGAFDDAYRIMSQTPAAKIQALKNTWEVFRVEIGDRVIPIIGQLAAVGKAALDWFLNLDDSTKDMIIKVVGLGAAFTVLVGVITALGGALLIVLGTLRLMAGAILPLVGMLATFVALSAAIVLIATKTQILQNAWEDIVNYIRRFLIPAFNLIKDAFEKDGWVGALKEAAGLVKSVFLPQMKEGFSELSEYLQVNFPKWREAVSKWIQDAAPIVAARLQELLTTIIRFGENILSYINNNAGKWGSAIWGWIDDVAPIVGSKLAQLGILFYKWLVDVTPTVLDKASDLVVNLIEAFGKIAGGILEHLPEIIGVLAVIGAAMIAYIVGTLVPSLIVAFAKIPGALIEALSSMADGLGKALADLFVLPKLFGVSEEAARVFADVITTVLVVALIALGVQLAGMAALWAAAFAANIAANISLIATNIATFAAGVANAAVSFGQLVVGIVTGTTTITLSLAGIAVAGAALGVGLVLLTQKIVGMFAQTSQYANDTAIDMEFVKQAIAGTAEAAAQDFETLRLNGQNVSAAFQELATQSPVTAQAIIDAMHRAGIDTTLYEVILKRVQEEHAKVGNSAEEGMRRAQSAANQYRADLDLLLGRITGVSTATANFDLAVASLSRQIDSNSTSTASSAEKQALLTLAFDRVYQSALGVIAQVKEHGLATDEDRAKVEAALSQMEAMAAANPGQAAALNLVIEKLRELASTPEVHKENVIRTRYFEEHHVSQENDSNLGTAGDPVSPNFMGGIIGYKIRALARGGAIPMAKAAMGRIAGFKTEGPTLVGEGNPNYPEFVIATDPAYRNRNLKLFTQAGHALQLFAAGGKIPDGMGDAMQGAIGQLRGAYGTIGSQLPNYEGEPGYKPSTEQILMSLNDISGILAGLGGLPGGNQLTLKVEKGAIVINGSGDPPEVIGMAVEDALNNFLRTLQSQGS